MLFLALTRVFLNNVPLYLRSGFIFVSFCQPFLRQTRNERTTKENMRSLLKLGQIAGFVPINAETLPSEKSLLFYDALSPLALARLLDSKTTQNSDYFVIGAVMI